jgi:NAD(P)-dependent dehydrogenase (short-subunit alcohol dehydrogenase family)
MARVFITGSGSGLGQLAAERLVREGHRVVLHARNQQRAQAALKAVPGAEAALAADLARMDEAVRLAEEANALGRFEAVIHNAGVYRASGIEIAAVNVLAPYILTCLMHKPGRLVYLSSGMHRHGSPDLGKLSAETWNINYSDSKLYLMLLMRAVARKWQDVYANAVDPGWVPTRMGGPGAPDNLQQGFETQAWLAVSDDARAKVSGRYFFHRREADHHPAAGNPALQDEFLARCEHITGVRFPAQPGE